MFKLNIFYLIRRKKN